MSGDADDAPELVPACIDDVLAAIACAIAPGPAAPSRLGSVTLHPHQREGAERILRIIERHGGALLCDAVGVGKTYVALAVASRFERCIVIAPAVLREMWTRAIAAAAVRATVVSVESLGRRREHIARDRALPAPLVIVDEAHHLRNPATRRYDAAARVCASARTLLLTATPLHNTRRDLAAVVALFAGVRAHAWTDDELASVVVRRDHDAIGALAIPRIEHVPVPAVVGVDDGVLDELLALPPPIPPADGAEATTLVTNSLVRQWTSSTAALRGALRRRIARGRALLAAFADGRHPTRAELREWVCTEDAVQLAFTELLAPAAVLDPTLRVTLGRHVDALAAVLRALADDDRADIERAASVHAICARHAPMRVVAFTCYQETAEMLWRALRGRVRAALLTGRGGLVAGGPLTRAETLARFAPDASGARAPADSERIDLLVTTDLLSEGVNLQDAGVVIHLDLPWTSARLAQRVGRLARVGSRHAAVTAYTLRPPARAEALLRTSGIIHRKATLAARVLGASSESAAPARWLDASTEAIPRTGVECVEAIGRRLAQHARPCAGDPARTLVARVTAPDECALAACVVDGVPRLVVVRDGRVETSAAAVLATIDAALASVPGAVRAGCADGRPALAAIDRWHRALLAARDAGVELPVSDSRVRAAMRTRRRAIARLDGAASSTPFARRDTAAARSATLRAAAAEPAPIGLERLLFAQSEGGSEGGSEDGVEERAERMRTRAACATSTPTLRVIALLLLAPSG